MAGRYQVGAGQSKVYIGSNQNIKIVMTNSVFRRRHGPRPSNLSPCCFLSFSLQSLFVYDTIESPYVLLLNRTWY